MNDDIFVKGVLSLSKYDLISFVYNDGVTEPIIIRGAISSIDEKNVGIYNVDSETFETYDIKNVTKIIYMNKKVVDVIVEKERISRVKTNLLTNYKLDISEETLQAVITEYQSAEYDIQRSLN